MKILILGSGVIGVTTAYFLKRRGFDVVVMDRESESARATSFANGGQLSYSHGEPWANPAAIGKALKWIGKKDAPLLFRFRPEYQMWSWTFQFLKNCTKDKTLQNTETLLRLGLYSRKVLHKIQDDLSLEFHHCKRGILHTFRTQKGLNNAILQSKYQEQFGVPYEILTPRQCVEKEPALKHSMKTLSGGLFYPLDESADICEFTKALANEEESEGVVFHYNTTVTGIKTEGKKIVAVETDKGDLEADIYVMSLGSYSPVFLRKIGINVPIYPLKGYSISISTEGYDGFPRVSITNQAEKMVYSRLGGILRVAGTAEFAGYDDSINKDRIDMLKDAAKRHFPNCGDIDNAEEWACLRSSTPDGPPILGKCRYDNLILNTGHGTLGWTQCFGSARIVTDIIDGKKPAIDLSGMTIERFE